MKHISKRVQKYIVLEWQTVMFMILRLIVISPDISKELYTHYKYVLERVSEWSDDDRYELIGILKPILKSRLPFGTKCNMIIPVLKLLDKTVITQERLKLSINNIGENDNGYKI